WESSQDTGPVTYRMYRADGDGEPRVIAGHLTAPSYSDKAVISGKRYRYAVSAIDETGNESEASATAEQVAP
ncbi:MAG: chitin-binding protein, partial [bacterium]|nr:chitin-binding protein [bacterium]